MSWLTRSILACFVAAFWAWTYGCPKYGPGWYMDAWVFSVVNTWAEWIGSAWYARPMVLAIAVALPTGAVAIGSYAAITKLWGPRLVGDGEMRCRTCGHILRGITEPRCSEYGERI